MRPHTNSVPRSGLFLRRFGINEWRRRGTRLCDTLSTQSNRSRGLLRRRVEQAAKKSAFSGGFLGRFGFRLGHHERSGGLWHGFRNHRFFGGRGRYHWRRHRRGSGFYRQIRFSHGRSSTRLRRLAWRAAKQTPKEPRSCGWLFRQLRCGFGRHGLCGRIRRGGHRT